MPVISLDPIAGQPLAERPEDRNAARDRGLEVDRHAPARRFGEQLAPFEGHERLVGGHHVLGPRQRFHDVGVQRRLNSADELDDDLDLRVLRERRPGCRSAGKALDALPRVRVRVANQGLFDRDRAAESPFDLSLVLLQDANNPGPHVASSRAAR